MAIHTQGNKDDGFLTLEYQKQELGQKPQARQDCGSHTPQGQGEGLPGRHRSRSVSSHNCMCSLLFENRCFPLANKAAGKAGQAASCPNLQGD